jgi:hypothetical protein
MSFCSPQARMHWYYCVDLIRRWNATFGMLRKEDLCWSGQVTMGYGSLLGWCTSAALQTDAWSHYATKSVAFHS